MISKFHPTIYQFEKGRPSDQAYHDLVGNLTGHASAVDHLCSFLTETV